MKKTLNILLFSFLVFLLLIIYNYQKAQKNIKDTKVAPLSINLVTYPESIKQNDTGSFVWEVNTTPDRFTDHTTIYYGYISSPSALTKNDTPEAVGYYYHRPDFAKGNFFLPDTFSLTIPFEQAGTVYFRAYARVGKDNLWTKEYKVNVNKSK